MFRIIKFNDSSIILKQINAEEFYNILEGVKNITKSAISLGTISICIFACLAKCRSTSIVDLLFTRLLHFIRVDNYQRFEGNNCPKATAIA